MKLSSLAAVLLCTAVSLPAFAIERSCNATLSMSWLGSSNGPPFPVQELDTFSARRSCGALVPNRCRERARNALNQCFSTAIAKKNALPTECISNGVRGYDVGRLDKAMERALCKEPAWRNRGYDVRLTMRTTGDTKCPGTLISPGITNVSTYSCPQGSN